MPARGGIEGNFPWILNISRMVICPPLVGLGTFLASQGQRD